MKDFLVCSLIVTICVTVRTTCDAAMLDAENDVDPLLLVSRNVVSDGETESRKKRGRMDLLMMKEGADAVTKLISGAKRIRSREKHVQVFQKAGDFKTAVQEFKSLRPSSLKEASYPFGHKVLYGTVGDRFIQVVNYGKGGKPTMTVLKQREDGVSSTAVRIKYTN